MRNSVIWSFFSIVALAGGGLLSGCDSDDAIAKSGAGESCDRTSDCADGLKCLEGTCYESDTGGGNEGGADGTGGSSVVGPKPEVLGREGESCTKRSDCEDGLGCYTGRCTDDAGGEGGSGTAGPRLGHPGETCVTGADCDKGLSCVPGGSYEFEGIPGLGNIGICSVGTTVTPSGKTCGAECVEAADCCELPVQLHAAWTVGATYGTGAQSCSELRSKIGNQKCTTAGVGTELAAQCFALGAYCDCADETWSCDAGACSYIAVCEPETALNTPDGCPTYSRSGRNISSICNDDGACAAQVGEPADTCARDADCEGMLVTADPLPSGKECSEDECVCHVDSGMCYRRCDSNLDCQAGYNCDEDTSLCTQAPACTTNEECKLAQPYLNVACDEGTCKTQCNNSLDCLNLSSEGDLWICAEDNFCAPLGCSSDAQCPIASVTALGTVNVRGFCTEPPVVEATVIQSAITD